MLLARDYNSPVKYGAKWLPSDIAGGGTNIYGNAWYVNATTGSDSNAGTTVNSPTKTIAAAVALASANDTIVIGPGTYTENVTVSLAGLRLIGAGTSVKQVIWTSTDGGTAATAYSLSLSAANCEVAGIYFKVPAYVSSAGVCSINLSNASYANIHDCRFQGQTTSYAAIYSAVENSDNVTIARCDFTYLNTASHGVGIYTLASGGLSYSFWKIENCNFSSCVTNILLAGARLAVIKGNVFDVVGVNASGTIGTVTTLGIELDGTSSGGNQVHANYLNGAYSSTLYKVGVSGDDWSGNYAIGGGTGVAAGVTTANPV